MKKKFHRVFLTFFAVNEVNRGELFIPSARTHDIHAKSTQDLGFPRYQFQLHARFWILQEPHEGFQNLGRNLRGFPSFTFFTNASFLPQNYSERQNLEKKNIFFRAHSISTSSFRKFLVTIVVTLGSIEQSLPLLLTFH